MIRRQPDVAEVNTTAEEKVNTNEVNSPEIEKLTADLALMRAERRAQ